MQCSVEGSRTSVTINNSNFTDSGRPKFGENFPNVHISCTTNNTSKIMFYRVQFTNNLNPNPPSNPSTINTAGTVSIVANNGGDVKINMSMVNFESSRYSGPIGGALTVFFPNQNGSDHCYSILIKRCKFVRNKSNQGAALYIDVKNDNTNMQIENTSFDQNIGSSIVFYTGRNHSQ